MQTRPASQKSPAAQWQSSVPDAQSNSFFAVAEETSNGLLKNDFALYTHLVYNLAYTLYTSYRWFGHDLPPWLIGGLAHWHGRRICPRFPAYEREIDNTNLEQREFWKWDERAPGLLRNGAFESIEALMRRPTMTEFGMEQHIQSWAFVLYRCVVA